MTEADLENSTDLLASKAEELRERLKEARLQLQKIQSSGEAMDGNTSTNEEEEFIQALNNEMPEVLDNIETNLGLLIEIEKLVPDVK
jgi:predicted  nucleic acid-binding Zn-ribbon protein